MGQGLKRPHRAAWWALVAAVVLAHWVLPREIANWAPRWDADTGMPERFALVGLTELRATAIRPPAAGPAAAPAPKPTRAAPAPPAASPEGPAEPAASAEAAASAPQPAASEPQAPPPSRPDDAASSTPGASALAQAASAPDASASTPGATAGASLNALGAAITTPIAAPTNAQTPAPITTGITKPSTDAATTATAATAPGSTASPTSSPTAGAPALQQAAGPASTPADNPTPGFVWPAATRLRYALRGYYHGEVQGQAKVDWAKQGNRYQINLDVGVNFALLELFSRRMSSEGRITAQGLAPERYDEETRIALKSPQRASVRIENGLVTLANGQREPAQPGLQDTVSQFVQLSWLFGNHLANGATLPAPGSTLEIPLALPNNFSVWVFDVQQPETLNTPFGVIDVIRVVPRRKASLGRSVLFSETWLAPGYRYLPVRIRITQGTAEGQPQSTTYLDLTITKPPLLADEVPVQGAPQNPAAAPRTLPAPPP